MVRQSPNSFGYVELIYARGNNMQFGSVKNAAGKFVKASTDGVTAAAAGFRQEYPCRTIAFPSPMRPERMRIPSRASPGC